MLPSQTSAPFQPYPVPPAVPPFQGKPKKSGGLGIIIALVICVILLVGSVVFGIWAYSSQQDYKNNSDQKAVVASDIAVKKESTKKDNEFLEKEKEPLKTYQGPADFGSVNVSYPKTWSAYVIEKGDGSTPLDGYFHPNFVPGTQAKTAYALRIQVTSQSFDSEMKQYESKVKAGKVKVTPFTAKNVPSAIGARIDGEINAGQNGSIVLLPLRDKTIKISTESQQFQGDFNNIVLPHLKFVP